MLCRGKYGAYAELVVLKVLVRVAVTPELSDLNRHAGHPPLALADRGFRVQISRDQRRVGSFVRLIRGTAAQMVLEAWLVGVGGQLG